MKKILLSTLVLSSVLFASSVPIKIPMDPKLLSQDKGGLLPAVDAYKDGVGIVVLGDLEGEAVNNESLNKLVYKYGNEAKDSDQGVVEYVLENSGLLPTEDVKLAQQSADNPIESTEKLLGSPCDDGDSNTDVDIIDSNNICVGYILGSSCDDGNPNTINDKIVESGCLGVLDTTAPTFTGSSISVAHGSNASITVPVEDESNVTLSISGAQSSYFTINNTTNSLIPKNRLDYYERTSYVVPVTATDQTGLTTTQNINVNLYKGGFTNCSSSNKKTCPQPYQSTWAGAKDYCLSIGGHLPSYTKMQMFRESGVYSGPVPEGYTIPNGGFSFQYSYFQDSGYFFPSSGGTSYKYFIWYRDDANPNTGGLFRFYDNLVGNSIWYLDEGKTSYSGARAYCYF